MIVKYGNYSFADGECSMINWRAWAKRTPKSVRLSTFVRADFAGEFCFSGPVDQNAIKAKILAAAAALNKDYQDLKVMHSDGTTESPYVMLNSDPTNVTGNIVTALSWPGETPEDYATTKQFAFTVQAEFVVPQVRLIDFQQTIAIYGTTGPITKWERFTGDVWRLRTLATSSTKRIVQSGFATAFGDYPMHATPILNRAWEHEEKRQIIRQGPSLFYRRPEVYTVQWKYEFETPFVYTPLNSYPPMA